MEVNDELKDHILESIGEGVFTVDKNFRINFFNKAAEKITGFSKDEVVGKFCKQIFKSELCITDCPIALVLKSNKNIYNFESRINRNTGDSIPIKLNAAVLKNYNQEPTGGIISFLDMSELADIKKTLERETNFHGMVGKSRQMQEIFELIREISDTNAPVLIQGESGTGKELVANAIQATGSRKDKTYIKVNCSVLPMNLLASELFGHVKGAFTDASKDRIGRFEMAHEGTLFLDEFAEMPPQMQLQLLRVIQEGTFERLGESISRKVDVRIIAATNLDISKALKSGQLREDLYYRLNVIPVVIPPLRERKDDIYPLVKFFLAKFAIIYNKTVEDIDNRTLEFLNNYNWPGNIRELENVIEFAFVKTSRGAIIESSKLPPIFNNRNGNSVQNLNQSFKTISPNTLTTVLSKHQWNKTDAANELGISRTTLWRILKKNGLIKK